MMLLLIGISIKNLNAMDKVFLLHNECARNGAINHKITVYGSFAKAKEAYMKTVEATEKSHICYYRGPALTIHNPIDVLLYNAYIEGKYNEYHDYICVEQKDVL